MRYCQSRGSNFLAANLRSWRPGQSYCDFQNHPFNQPQMQINTLRETGKRWTLRLLWCNWKDLDDRSLAMSKSWWSGGYWMRYCWLRDGPSPTQNLRVRGSWHSPTLRRINPEMDNITNRSLVGCISMPGNQDVVNYHQSNGIKGYQSWADLSEP